jgi:acyl carrier protein
MATVKERLYKIIQDKLCAMDDEMTPEASFLDDLGADSLDVIDLIMEVEREFSISIPDETAEGLTTIGKLEAFLEERLSY